MTRREATKEEADRFRAQEMKNFGMRVVPCESVPPRHTPFVASDGRTYCTTCGEDITA